MEKQIEHASKSHQFAEERKAVFLKGYYHLLDSEIAELENNKVINNTKDTPTDEKK
jgi:hypothetical protein